MDGTDARLLSDMRSLVARDSDLSELFELVQRLLTLRDLLSFEDDSWYEQFTSNVVTLDSGGSFAPRDDFERAAAHAAITRARQQLLELIGAKSAAAD